MLGVSISTYGAYEEGRAEPKLENLQKITGFFGIKMEVLLSSDLTLGETRGEGQIQKREDVVPEEMTGMRVLAITVDGEGRDNVEWVPEKAAAGYTAGFGDPSFISTLPSFRLPFLLLLVHQSYNRL